MRCNDCGEANYEPSARMDVCKPCFQLRLDFIAARKRGEVSPEEFARVQRTMSGQACEGQAAEMMRAMLDPEAWMKEPF